MFQLSIYNIGHYDSFILYALALNDTLANGEDPRDGLGVVKRMWNRTFPGMSLLILNPSGKCVLVLNIHLNPTFIW